MVKSNSTRAFELSASLTAYSASHRLQDLLQEILDRICAEVQSPIGFLHFIGEDQRSIQLQAWSRQTVAEFCDMDPSVRHYPLDQAGIWADALRRRCPVIVNDYPNFPGRRGLPEGHAHVERTLVVPVFREDKVVALLGVGNKRSDYDAADEALVSDLADFTWEVVTRKRVEERLLQSESRWQSLAEELPALVCALDEEGRATFLNQTYCATFSLAADDYLEVECARLPHFAGRSEEWAALDSLTSAAPRRVAEHLVTLAGQRRSLRWTTTARFDSAGRRTGFLSVGEDLSEINAFRDELLQKNSILRVLKRCNAAIARLEDRRELLARIPEILVAEPSFSRACLVVTHSEGGWECAGAAGEGGHVCAASAALEEFAASGAWTAACELRKGPGRSRLALPLLGRTGALGGLLVESAGPSFTAIEQAALAELAESVGGALRALEDRRERDATLLQLQQSQRLESVGRLAGGIAHDFNNMLSVVVGNAELALGALSDDLHVARSRLEAILEASGKAANLVQNLLAFSRRQTLDPEPLEISARLVGLEDGLLGLLGEDVELRVRCEEPVWILADPVQFEQIVLNLAVNARHAMPRGGRLEISARAAELDAELSKRIPGASPGETWALLEVRDQGEGMSAATLKQAFEPFFSTRAGGAGLGLATVYGIVRQTGGAVWAESAPGLGTCVSIALPRLATPEPENLGAPHERTPAPIAGRERLLLVEDQGEILGLLEEVLSARGHEVHVATSGTEALQLVRDGLEPTVLVSDVRLPGLTGPELAVEVRKLYPQLPVLFMSGYSAEALVDGLPPNSDFLAKPFRIGEFLHLLGRLLSGR